MKKTAINTTAQLALLGGIPVIQTPHPHFVWPPQSSALEKIELGEQRDRDISIKGRSGPIFQLEEEFLKFLQHQRKFAITFNSGTAALMASYFALGIGEDDEVICPAITYHAAVTPLYFLKANPVLVDVDARTWTLDPDLIEAAITPQTKAITVVHQWGHPGDMDAIMEIAKKHNLKVIEDCSHAHGSTYKGKQVGTFGDIAVFSLQANKIVFAGEGGILVTNSTEYHDRATLLGHYRDRARDEIKDPFYQQFWVTGYGLKLRMSPYNAITARYALQELEKNILSRYSCLSYFSQKLAHLPEISVPYVSPTVTMGAWYGFKPIYHSEKLFNIPREKYIQLLKSEGVEVSEPGSPAFSELPLFQIKDDKMYTKPRNKRTYQLGDFPVAEKLAKSALSLPTFTNWPKDKKMIDQYAKAFQKVHDLAHQLQGDHA
jgi:dTDP-4-amino-4,6-dideoxygalactose transaminase